MAAISVNGRIVRGAVRQHGLLIGAAVTSRGAESVVQER